MNQDFDKLIESKQQRLDRLWYKYLNPNPVVRFINLLYDIPLRNQIIDTEDELFELQMSKSDMENNWEI